MAKMTMKAEISFWSSKSAKLEDKCRLLETENADLRAESLALREQLAEFRALEPVAEMRTWPKNISGPNPDWFWFGKQDFPVGTQLFTAAKPAED